MQNLLAISTTAGCIVAVRANGKTVIRTNPERHGLAEYLVPLIKNALAEAGIGFADLHRIGAVTGPGSFTGLRVGLATAQGLQLALDCELVGITAFDLYRHGVAGKCAVALDTLRGDCFSAGYDGEAMWLEPAVRMLNEIQAMNVPVYGDLPFATKPDDAQLADSLLALTVISAAPATPYYLREAEISKPKTVVA